MTRSVDPRLEERRISVTRARGRRRLRMLAVVVGLVLAAFVAFGVSRSPLFAVERIAVEGASTTDEAAILDVVGIDDGDPILYVDLAAAARRIEALPWIATAEVERNLPRTVRITVTERTPIAWVAGPDAGEGPPIGVVDAEGRLLEIVAQPPAMAEVVGLTFDEFAPGVTSTTPEAVEVLAALPAELATRVGSVVVADGGESVVVHLVDGPDLHLGDTTDVPTKASAALAVLAALGDEPVTVVDVSVPLAPTTRAAPVDGGSDG